MRMPGIVTVAVALFVAAVPPGQARSQDSVSLAGAVVRVSARVPPLRQRVGRVLAIDADTLWLSDGSERIAIGRAMLTAVDLQVPVQRAPKAAYAVLGLVVGAAAGAIVGREVMCSGPPRCETNNWGTAFGMLGGAAIGSIAGVAIRSLRHNWAWEPLPLR